MAAPIDQIRGLAERVAASHGLEVVDVEFGGGGKSRALRVFVEKNAEERARIRQRAEAGEESLVPRGVPVEALSGVTHEDCAAFANDFGTLIDVEDVVPGSEYTLEVSSPGLERRLVRPEDFVRFTGSLVRLKTFAPVNGSRQWTGRLTAFADGVLCLSLDAVRQAGRKRTPGSRAAGKGPPPGETLQIPLADIEKANLAPEF